MQKAWQLVVVFGFGSKPMVPFGVGAPPILVCFSGWIGMFTGGTWPYRSNIGALDLG